MLALPYCLISPKAFDPTRFVHHPLQTHSHCGIIMMIFLWSNDSVYIMSRNSIHRRDILTVFCCVFLELRLVSVDQRPSRYM